MRSTSLSHNHAKLARSVAVLLLGGIAAGCSSGVSRFNGVDDIFTSTTNQQNIIPPAAQPYPAAQSGSSRGGDGYSYSAAPAAPASSGVSRSALPPAGGTQVAAAAPAPALAPAGQSAPALAPAASGQPSAADRRPLQPSAADATQTAPVGNMPAPEREPERVAVLPQPAKPKESQQPANTGPAPVGNGTDASGGYVVQEGDSLARIARKTGVSVAAIRQANGLQDGIIRVGQRLTIPAAGATQVAATPVKAEPNPAASAPTQQQPQEQRKVTGYTPPKKDEKVIEQAEEVAAVAPDSTGIGRMRWPVRGRVISGFGSGGGKKNDGIDIAVPEGTPVKAAENGVVIYAGDGLKDFGNTVLVRHENGLVTVYGHASELKVQRGEKVKRGQEIARSGMTGTTEMPKLHFEVRKNSAPVDPSTYLE